MHSVCNTQCRDAPVVAQGSTEDTLRCSRERNRRAQESWQQKQQEALSALEEVCDAVHAQLQAAKAALDEQSAQRRALQHRLVSAATTLAELQQHSNAGYHVQAKHHTKPICCTEGDAPVAPAAGFPPSPASHLTLPQLRPPRATPPTPELDAFTTHMAISTADASAHARCHDHSDPLDPHEIIEGARRFMASAAAERGVDEARVCWWFQSGFCVAEGGVRLSWSTGLCSPSCTAAFAAFYKLNALECAFLDETRAMLPDARGGRLIEPTSASDEEAAAATAADAYDSAWSFDVMFASPAQVPEDESTAGQSAASSPQPPHSSVQMHPTRLQVQAQALHTLHLEHEHEHARPQALPQQNVPAPPIPARKVGSSDASEFPTNDMYTASQERQPQIPGEAASTAGTARPQVSCGVNGFHDAEAAVAFMLRRLVRHYRSVLPAQHVCAILQKFTALVQRFAASSAASVPQERYPPAVLAADVQPARPAETLCLGLSGGAVDGGLVEGEEPDGSLGVQVHGATDSMHGFACVIAALLSTALQLLLETQQSAKEAYHVSQTQRAVLDSNSVREQALSRVLDGGLNGFLMHSHMSRLVCKDMLEFRACVDGTFCQLEHCNMRICSIIQVTPRQATEVQKVWHQWVGHRRALDAQLAAAQHAFQKLPTSEAIPAAFLRRLGAVAEERISDGGGTEWTSQHSACCGRTTAEVPSGKEESGFVEEFVGVTAKGAAVASAAMAAVRAVSTDERSGFAEFFARVWLPSPGVDEWQLLSTWAAVVKCCAMCDMLRVLQLVVQKRKQQQLAGGLEQLQMNSCRCAHGEAVM